MKEKKPAESHIVNNLPQMEYCADFERLMGPAAVWYVPFAASEKNIRVEKKGLQS